MNAAIILAGGRGERLTGYDTPKQYLEVGGKRVIDWCLEAFKASPDVELICIVADEKYHSQIGGYLFAEPGVSRQHSVYNGLLALKRYSPQHVVIHDAARPCVTAEDIRECIRACEGYAGATPVCPVTETVYRSHDGKTIDGTLNRDELFSGQTPECYDFKRYLAAHESFSDRLSGFRGSSEIAVAAGMKIALAKGSPANFKITTNADLERFRYLLHGRVE